MKKVIRILILTVCSPMLLWGQESNPRAIKYGVHYSQNFAQQLYHSPSNKEYGKSITRTLYTFGVGVNAEKPINDQLSLNAAIGYQQKGSRDYAPSFNAETDGIKMRNRFDNITLSFNPILYLNKKTIRPYILGGLSANLLLNRRADESNDDYINSRLYYHIPTNGGLSEETESFKRLVLGYEGGWGLRIKNRFAIEGKIQYDINPAYSSDNLEIKNLLWTINLKFDLQGILPRS